MADEIVIAHSAAGFDPVAAEHDVLDISDEPIEFTFDDDLRNADDVLSLDVQDAQRVQEAAHLAEPDAFDVDALPTFLQDTAAGGGSDGVAASGDMDADAPAPVEDAVPADALPDDTLAVDVPLTPVSGGVHEAVIGKIDLDDESARFLAELDAAAAQFTTQPVETPVAATLAPDTLDTSIDAGFEDDGENIDQDIRDVFIEEFDEELENLGNLLPAWRAAPDNLDRLRPIRRVFHTLKGSGRLVGARTLGEFSWKVEGMLNRVLDGSRAATPAVVAMVTQAYEVLPQLNAALRGDSRVTADLQAMQAIADRVAAGEETFHVPLQRPAPVAAPVAENTTAETPVEPALEVLADAPVESGTPANIDSVLREILEAEVDTHLATLHAWLDSAAVTPAPVTDLLLRAMHTMNGAFAMTEVPEITAVTGAAESFIKRSLAAGETPETDGVAALRDAAAAITVTMNALQTEFPRIPVQHDLAARLQALADRLPEARWPALVDDDAIDVETAELDALDADVDVEVIDAIDAIDAEPVVEAVKSADADATAIDAPSEADAHADERIEDIDAVAVSDAGQRAAADPLGADVLPDADASVQDVDAAGFARADASDDVDVQDAELEADGLVVLDAADLAADEASVLSIGDLTGSDDLSRFLDETSLPAALATGTAGVATASGDDADADVVVAVDAVLETAANDTAADGLDAVELTAADDLSRYFGVVHDNAGAAPADHDATDAAPPAFDGETFSDEEEDALIADAHALDDVLPPVPSFGEPVDTQQALDDGLTVVDAPEGNEAPVVGVIGLDASNDDGAEADAFADAMDDTGTQESAATRVAPTPFFELEQSTVAIDASVDAPASSATLDADADPGQAPTRVDGQGAEDAADALDFSVLDQELVDIFVEEGKDLLDHCDGLISELRVAPQDRDVLAGLQRDLHTLKGGARMAGINPIGDLGHGIESLLEAVAANRTDIDRSDVHLLERGFDRLHQMLTRTGDHRTVAMPDDLIAAFEQRTQGRAVVVEDALPAEAPVVEDRNQAVADAIATRVAAPLSAPVPLEVVGDDDALARPQQEQVRVRADLLDRLVNHAGEVAIYRSRLEQQLGAFRGAMSELDRTNARLRDQLRRLDLETEAQIVARYQREQDQADHKFDPLELDRFSTLQQLSRALNESAADLGGLQGVLDDLSRQYDVLLQQQSRVSSELQDGLMRARMVPFDGLVPRLRRVVRQAGQDTGKQVHVTLEGTHGELDRNVLDRMVAPLEHMLRNSVAHGLETPEQRRAAGKPEEGEIAIRQRREGSEIVLEVADDGAGLDRDAIRRRAEQRGLIEADAVLNDTELDAMIFASGFSTADQVSQLAGRGVGMDVVHNEVRQLGGSVDIHSVRGQGVTFTLRLPQTLAVTQAVFVQIGDTTYAVPVASVSGIGRISRERFESTSAGVYHYGGEEFALHDLGTLVGQAQARAEGQAQVPLLLVRAGDLRAAVAIDQVLGNREIVVKPVGLQIASVPGIYGATITGDGRVVVILDVAPLVRRFLANPHKPIAVTTQVSDRDVPLVMVVDDSLTMRKVTGRILERHNFEVTVARDGVEALERLEERVPDLMLLDIEMPRMDGYELATAMRADPRYQQVPIVMITSRSGDKHRQRAFEIGVQRYLGKPYQELDLMRNVYDLLGIARVRE